MRTCFVIQPFNEAGKRRFDGLFEPAIRDAGLRPERADTATGRGAVIESIHAGILGADVCLADISTDNPNVWYELGVALSAHKRTLIVCSDERPTSDSQTSTFPFNIQHLGILTFPASEDHWDESRRRIASDLSESFAHEREFECKHVGKLGTFKVSGQWSDDPVRATYKMSDARMDYQPKAERAHISAKLSIRKLDKSKTGINLDGVLIGSGPVYDGYAFVPYRIVVRGEEKVLGLCAFRPLDGGQALWITPDLESEFKELAIGTADVVEVVKRDRNSD